MVASGGHGRPPTRERAASRPRIPGAGRGALAQPLRAAGVAVALASATFGPAARGGATARAEGPRAAAPPTEGAADALARARSLEEAGEIPGAVAAYGAIAATFPYAREAAEADARRAWLVARGGAGVDAARLARLLGARARGAPPDRGTLEALTRDADEASAPLLRAELRLFAASTLQDRLADPRAALGALDDAARDPSTPPELAGAVRLARARALGALDGPSAGLAALSPDERRASDVGHTLRRERGRRALARAGVGAAAIASALVGLRARRAPRAARRDAIRAVRGAATKLGATLALVGGAGAALASALGAPATAAFAAVGATAFAFAAASVAAPHLFPHVPASWRALVAGTLTACAATGALAATHAPILARFAP